MRWPCCYRALRKGQIVHDLLPLFAPHDSGRPNWAQFLMQRFKSSAPQPASSVFTVICEWAFEIPRFRAIRGISRRLCVSDRAPKASFPPPVSEGYFSCLVFDGAFGLRSSRSTNAPDADGESLWGMCTSQEYARGSTGSGYPGPGRGEVAAIRVRRFSKITMV